MARDGSFRRLWVVVASPLLAGLCGFAGGYLSSLILDPLKPERVDHLAVAVVCLLVTFIAIVWSVITALPFFQ